MRPYLYIWNDPIARRVTASGLELRDLHPALNGRGMYLLRHAWDGGDLHQGLTFATLPELAGEDLYAWGDLAWADFPSREPPTLTPEPLAELLYFGHAFTPLRDVRIPGLGNRFLGVGHDDGWLMALCYSDWRDVEDLLRSLIDPRAADEIMDDLRDGTCAYWLEAGTIEREEMTVDLDRVLNRRHPRPC
jgi:hypothetical protein